MTAAIFGLVGVIVGAIVTGGVDLYMERRREDALTRRAKLLVGEQLHTAWVQLGLLVETGHTPNLINDEARARFLATDAWHTYKVELTRNGVLSADDWTALSTTMHNIETFRLVFLEQPHADAAAVELSGDDRRDGGAGRPALHGADRPASRGLDAEDALHRVRQSRASERHRPADPGGSQRTNEGCPREGGNPLAERVSV
jgi:hypothetical protein